MLFYIEYSILIITLDFLWKVNLIISDDTFGAIVANYYEDGADAIVPMAHMMIVLVELNSTYFD